MRDMSRFFAWTAAWLVAACGGDAAPTKHPASPGPTATSSTPPVPEADKKQPSSAVRLVEVATSDARWTGVAVTPSGRIFVNYPRWQDPIDYSVAELKDGKPAAYPPGNYNGWKPKDDPTTAFVCVQSVFSDTRDQLWVLDSGNPNFRGVVDKAPKLVRIDLTSDEVKELMVFTAPAVLPNSYLNDVRIDLDTQTAIMTDSGAGGLVLLDLRTGAAKRVLDDHPSTLAEDVTLQVGGKPWLRGGTPPKIHADGLALTKTHVYYQALSGRTLYRIDKNTLLNPLATPSQLSRAVEKVAEVGGSDGLLAAASGAIYLTSVEQGAIRRLEPGGKLTLISDDARIEWPDSLAKGPDGIYFTTSQIHHTAPRGPFRLFRFKPPR